MCVCIYHFIFYTNFIYYLIRFRNSLLFFVWFDVFSLINIIFCFFFSSLPITWFVLLFLPRKIPACCLHLWTWQTFTMIQSWHDQLYCPFCFSLFYSIPGLSIIYSFALKLLPLNFLDRLIWTFVCSFFYVPLVFLSLSLSLSLSLYIYIYIYIYLILKLSLYGNRFLPLAWLAGSIAYATRYLQRYNYIKTKENVNKRS